MGDILCEEAAGLLQKIMEDYFFQKDDLIEDILAYFSKDIIMFGTGKHEFYENLPELVKGFRDDMTEAEGIEFIIEKAWYKAHRIGSDACVAYGEVAAREKNTSGKRIIINMDTRITASIHREPEGNLIVDTIHHSVPYIYQRKGEHYPVTFADRAEEALKRSEVLEKNIQLDPLTALYNRKYTELHINRILKEERADGGLFLLDMDNFKLVNDRHGHLTGDDLLMQISKVLKKHAGDHHIAGRVGGDEFVFFLKDCTDRKEGEAFANGLIEEIEEVTKRMNLEHSCSIGGVFVRNGEPAFEEAYSLADLALYRVKDMGKGKFSWFDNEKP